MINQQLYIAFSKKMFLSIIDIDNDTECRDIIMMRWMETDK